MKRFRSPRSLYQNDQLIISAYSNFDGAVFIDSIPYGIYDVKIQSLGYVAVELDSVFFGFDPIKRFPTAITTLSPSVGISCFHICEIIELDTVEPILPIATDSILAEEELTLEDVDEPEGFNVYPNPAADVINMHGVESSDQWMVFDLLGNMVMQPSPGSTLVNVSLLPSGAYILQRLRSGEVLAQTIVKL